MKILIKILRCVVYLLLVGIASCSGLSVDKFHLKLEKRKDVPPDPGLFPGGGEAIDLLMGEGEILLDQQASGK